MDLAERCQRGGIWWGLSKQFLCSFLFLAKQHNGVVNNPVMFHEYVDVRLKFGRNAWYSSLDVAVGQAFERSKSPRPLQNACSMLMPLRCCLETNRILQNLYFKARASDMSKNADLQLANCIKAKTSQKISPGFLQPLFRSSRKNFCLPLNWLTTLVNVIPGRKRNNWKSDQPTTVSDSWN